MQIARRSLRSALGCFFTARHSKRQDSNTMTKHAIFLSLTLLTSAALTPGLASAFHPDQPAVVAISCANQGTPPCCGNHLKFNATVGRVEPKDKISYTWSLSKGRILSGQGTSTIEIDASDAKEQPILVTLEVMVTFETRFRGRKRRQKDLVSASYKTCSFPRRRTSAQLTAQ